MKMTLLRLIALVWFAAVVSLAADLSGKWRAEFDTQVGKQSYLYDLKADGEKVTGTAAGNVNGEKHSAEIKNGKLKGDEVTFTEAFEFQGNTVEITYTGKLAGDEIRFTRKVGDFATEQLVAKRAPSETFSGAKGTVQAAIEKLAGQSGYEWKSETQAAGPFGSGTVEGKTEKGGFTTAMQPGRNGTLEWATKGRSKVVNDDGLWQPMPATLEGMQGFRLRIVADFKLPSEVAADVLGKAGEPKLEGDAYVADLPESAASDLLAGGGRRAGDSPITGASGSVRFWISDGLLSKIAVALAGSREFNGNPMKLDRTTTTVFSEVGSAVVNCPKEARAILEALEAGQTPPKFTQDFSKIVKVPKGFRYEALLVGDIPEPLDLEFCPDGRLWFTGRRGHVWAYDFATKTNVLIAELSVGWQSPTNRETNERGLHGIEFDPGFSKNGYVYLHYAPPPKDGKYVNRLVRFAVDNPVRATRLVDGSEKVLLEYDSPKGYHMGGAIEYNSKDGKLYVSTGDNNAVPETKIFWKDPNNPVQRLDNLQGKTLRLNLDGSIPSDNPFVGKAGARGEIFTYGHRNPYSMVVDAETGNVYVGEIGYDNRDSYEEVNLLRAGGNYGWPRLQGPDKPIFPEDQDAYKIENPIQPIVTYTHDQGANATVGPVYRAPQGAGAFPAEYQNGLFYADWARKSLRFAELDSTGTQLVKTSPFALGFTAGMLSLHQGPDGALYFVEYGGWFTGSPKDKLARIIYDPSSPAVP